MEDVTKELNKIEKIIVKLFPKTFMKVYNVTRVMIVNNLMQF